MTVCCTRLQSDVRLFNCVQGWRDEIIARKERENKAAQGTKRERERERAKADGYKVQCGGVLFGTAY